MNEERRCAIETLSEETGVPFVSIKNTEEPSVLVINPNSYPDIDWRATTMGFQQVNRRWLEAVCAECSLCESTVESDPEAKTISGTDERYGYRIYRHGLSREMIERPLYKIQTHTLYSKDKKNAGKRLKISCVDDAQMGWKGVFANPYRNTVCLGRSECAWDTASD